MNGQHPVTKANWRRYLLVILLDYAVFSAFYWIILAHYFPANLSVWQCFFLVESFVFFYKKWMLSPGMYLMSIYQTVIEEGERDGGVGRYIARLVDDDISQRENWLTIALGVLLFTGGLKSIVAWFSGTPLFPIFGVIPPPLGFFVYLLVTGLMSLFAGYGFLKLRPSALWMGLALMIGQIISTVLSWELWGQFIESLLASEGVLETDMVGKLQTFIPATYIAVAAIASCVMLMAKACLVDAADYYEDNISEQHQTRNILLLSIFLTLVVTKCYFALQQEKHPYQKRVVDFREMVDDFAEIMDEQQRRAVANYHNLLLQHHDIDLRVVTRNQANDLNAYSHKLFTELDVGKHSKTGRGLLLVINTANDEVRLEVSAALEGVYPDAFIAYIQQRQMVYFFNSGRVADGVLAAAEMIVTRAQQAEKNIAFAPDNTPAFTTGAGAKTSAYLNKGKDLPGYREKQEEVTASNSPVETVNAYIDAMRDRNARADLDIYTRDSQLMLAGWTVTPAQMDNIVKAYRQCPEPALKENGDYAVVRYAVEQRRCSPWFLAFENDSWKLDLTMMKKGIQFNHNNEWRLKRSINPTYMFAFSDWRFDRQGYPFPTSY